VGRTKDHPGQGTRKFRQGAAAATLGAAAMAQIASHNAARRAQEAAQLAAQSAAQRAQQAAAGMQTGLRAGSDSARGWVAPRLEDAADFTESTAAPAVSDAVVNTLAPRVAAALRSTARQVSPVPRPSGPSARQVLTVAALTVAAVTGISAAAALAWRRYRAAMAADTEAEAAPDNDAATDGTDLRDSANPDLAASPDGMPSSDGTRSASTW
jgi:hypothetical protein